LKKIGPCKILRRFGENYYELGIPEDVGISPIFNIADLYLMQGHLKRASVKSKDSWKSAQHKF
jgi:hypothetical protein